jgi:beta-lactamase class A
LKALSLRQLLGAVVVGASCALVLLATWNLALAPRPQPTATRTATVPLASAVLAEATPAQSEPTAARSAPTPTLLPPPPTALATAALSTATTVQPTPTIDDRPAPTASPGPAESPLAERARAVMAGVARDASVVFLGDSGEIDSRQLAEVSRFSASVIKLPLVLEVLRQGESGQLGLSETHTIRPADVVGGTGKLQGQVGRTVTLEDLARYAILYSDNVAANLLLDRLGMERVNAAIAAAGFPGTHFERRFLDTAAQARGLENRTTAADLAAMLQRVWQRSYFGPPVSQQMLDLLAQRAELDPPWIGPSLPPGAKLYHLSGILDGVRNDAGIVSFGAGRWYVLAICQDHLADDAAGERAIGTLARQLHALVAPGGA